MTEKDKMLGGMLYNAFRDDSLLPAYDRAKEMCFAYNNLSPAQKNEKRALLENLLGKVGKNAVIMPVFFCDYGFNIEAGDNLYINHNCVILDCAPVRLGHNVLLGPNCGLYTAAHPLAPEPRRAGLEYARPISIGDNVWVGGNVVILPGVTVGENSVIGAGSVVNRDIPPGVVAVGNPCRALRELKDGGDPRLPGPV